MAKGDYPTGALVEVIRKYKENGGNLEIYERAKQELKYLLMCLIKYETAEPTNGEFINDDGLDDAVIGSLS